MIEKHIKEIKKINTNYGIKLEDYDHFTYLCTFLNTDETEYEVFLNNIDENKILFTNGANDSGIDSMIIDRELECVTLVQTKHYKEITQEIIRNELLKISSNLEKLKQGILNSSFQSKFNSYRISDYNFEYFFYTSAIINERLKKKNKIMITEGSWSLDQITICGETDIQELWEEQVSGKHRVAKKGKILLDEKHNKVSYSTSNSEAHIINISATELAKLYAENGNRLFEYNVRKYIKNKKIDTEIKTTIQKEPENFWFYNNGITIVAESVDFDSDNIKLENFSVVNGAQTTKLISDFDDKELENIYILCKIIEIANSKKNKLNIYNITKSNNSQKAINGWDLISNDTEIRKLSEKKLQHECIQIKTKRGEPNKKGHIILDTKKLFQLVHSCYFEDPVTSRSTPNELLSESKKTKVFEKLTNLKEIINLIKLSNEVDIRCKEILSTTEKVYFSELCKKGQLLILFVIWNVNREYNLDDYIEKIKESDLINTAIKEIGNKLFEAHNNYKLENEEKEYSNILRTKSDFEKYFKIIPEKLINTTTNPF